MSRETEAQGGMLREQLRHDREMRVGDRLDELFSQGSKGLVILNGGAAVAMLAFVQALVERPVYRAFKPFAVGALTCFLLGAFLSAIAFFFWYVQVVHAFHKTGHGRVWQRVSWGMLVAGALAAFAGGALVATGIWFAV